MATMARTALAACAAAACLVPPAFARTIRVPQSQTSIQAAIDEALSGDTVLVADGQYDEALVIRDRQIVLRSEHGPAATHVVACGPRWWECALTLERAGATTVSGFSFSGNVAVWARSGQPLITDCVLSARRKCTERAGCRGAGLVSEQASVRLQSCTIAPCRRIPGEPPVGIDVREASLVALDCCIIAYNTISVTSVTPGSIQLTDCDVFGNALGDWVDGIAGQAATDGNFSADPLFCDAAGGDYSLSAESECAEANNARGMQVGALGPGCPPACGVWFDIKPGSCPNALNVKGDPGKDKPVLPAAILGTEDFDVRDIDPATLSLMGVSPVRWSYEDAAAPVTDPAYGCDCTADGPDGHEDLVLKFPRSEVIAAVHGWAHDGGLTDGTDMAAGAYAEGDNQVTLTITGALADGTPIEGQDCLVLAHGDEWISPGTPRAVVLAANYPNPFNATTRIRFTLPEAQEVRLDVFNILGRHVAGLLSGRVAAGEHTVTWDAGNISSGVYFFRLQSGDFTRARSMMLLR